MDLMLSLLSWPPVAVAAACILLLWWARWRDYRLTARLLNGRTGSSGDDDDDDDDASALMAGNMHMAPKVTVVVPCCNVLPQLKENLPALLEQEGIAYEVVVVDEASSDGTREWLEYYSEQQRRLRHTFVPQTARYVDRRKLAITLGVRAARAPWVIITQADCRPAYPTWLATMAEHFHSHTDIVLGYANYEEPCTRQEHRAAYERLHGQIRRYRAAMGMGGKGNGRAWGGDVANLAFRKEVFMAQQGFADFLTTACDEGDALVSTMATAGRTAVCCQTESTVWQSFPFTKSMHSMRLIARETLRHLTPGARRSLWREGAASASLYVLTIALAAHAVWAALTYSAAPERFATLFPIEIAAMACLVTALAWPVVALRRITHAMEQTPFSAGRVWLQAYLQPWRNMAEKVARYRHRRDFLRKQ